MSADFLYDAIGEIREEFLEEAEQGTALRRRHRFHKLLAACAAVVLLALPVSAEVRTGYICNLLMPLYGGAQTELVDSIGVPLNASTTANGYILTADAVIGDRYNVAVVYSLRREDGGPMPNRIQFSYWDSGFTKFLNPFGGGGGGGSLSFDLSPDRTTLKITEQWSSSGRLFLFGRRCHTIFRDLEVWDPETHETTPLLEGTWELEFTIRYEDTTRTDRVDDLEVVNSQGDKFTVHRVELSPFGVNIRLTVPNPSYGLPELPGNASEAEILARSPKQFEFALKLKDGTVIPVEGGGGSHGKTDEPTFRGDFHAMFDQPVPLEQIEALLFCGTEYPLK